MALRSQSLDAQIATLGDAVAALRPQTNPTQPNPTISRAIERFGSDALAARFHLTRREDGPVMLVLIGGTGTGKSTLLNRLLGIAPGGVDLTATSFRRTFTAGPVAAAADLNSIPNKWLGVDPQIVEPANLPARGQPDTLMLVQHDSELTRHAVVVDTPDLDGDQPLHHAQADRVFRWADAVLFLVTPEKYQMTELLPYYRLAARYGLPAVFVMNKTEEQSVVDDYAAQLRSRGDRPESQAGAANLYALPRDDAGYEPPPEMNLASLRAHLQSIHLPDANGRQQGVGRRVADLLGRLRDQILAPLRNDRQAADRLIASLRAMESPSADVDVNPLTQALRRRLQQQSVLYLMGPGRVLDRVRQVPALLARLPRSTMDLLRGRAAGNGSNHEPDHTASALDFRTALVDQFTVVQSRVDDVLRSNATGAAWVDNPSLGYAGSKFPAEEAGRIADEELDALKKWMTQRWNATPRDTALIKKLVRHLPGGEKLTAWSEAAPYLVLLLSIATSHVTFGMDTAAGVLVSAWLGSKLSDEVAAHARNTNRRLAQRFALLAHAQIKKTCAWLDSRAPAVKSLDAVERLIDEMAESAGGS